MGLPHPLTLGEPCAQGGGHRADFLLARVSLWSPLSQAAAAPRVEWPFSTRVLNLCFRIRRNCLPAGCIASLFAAPGYCPIATGLRGGGQVSAGRGCGDCAPKERPGPGRSDSKAVLESQHMTWELYFVTWMNLH